MFDNLTDRLSDILQQVKGEGKLTTENVDKALVEVRRALIEADVNLTVIKTFLSRVRQSAVGEKIVQGVTPSQKFIQIVNDELVQLLGGSAEGLNLSGKPNVILLMGLQGSGKTTTAGKLAQYLKKQNKKVMLVALDLQRPAAIDQLAILAEQVGVAVHKPEKSTSVLEVAQAAYQRAQLEKIDHLIFDTAGRLQIDNDLMAELLILEKKFQPSEKLLVIDSLIGQEAAEIANTFNTQIGITGSVLTKLDGDSRGGAALSIVEITGKKIKLAGVSEKLDGLEVFEPSRVADRILGFGDVVSLVKSLEENINKKEAEQLEKKLMEGDLSFDLFLKMQKLLGKVGGFANIFNMLGMGNKLGINRSQQEELLSQGQEKFKVYEYMIQSMTLEERQQPDLLSSSSRKRRIAKGCGMSEAVVNQMVEEFTQMRKTLSAIKPLLNGLKSGGSVNPMDMMNMQNKLQKQKKQDNKKQKKSIFGGGAFFDFN